MFCIHSAIIILVLIQLSSSLLFQITNVFIFCWLWDYCYSSMRWDHSSQHFHFSLSFQCRVIIHFPFQVMQYVFTYFPTSSFSSKGWLLCFSQILECLHKQRNCPFCFGFFNCFSLKMYFVLNSPTAVGLIFVNFPSSLLMELFLINFSTFYCFFSFENSIQIINLKNIET